MRYLALNKTIKIRLIEQLFSITTSNMVFPFMITYFYLEWGNNKTSILMIITGFLSVLLGFYGGHLSDKLGRISILINAEYIRFLALILMVIGSLPIIDSTVLVFASMSITGFCSGFISPAGQAMLIDESSEEDREFIYSFNYWANNFAVLVGGLLGGFLFENYRIFLLIFVSIMSLVTIILLKFFIKETYTPSTNKKSIPKSLTNNYKKVFTDKTFLVFQVASLIESSVEYQARTYLLIYFVNVISKERFFTGSIIEFEMTGYLMFSLVFTINTVIVLISGTLINNITKRIKTLRLLTIGIIIYSLGYGLMTVTNNIVIIILLMVFITIAELSYVPKKMLMLTKLIPENQRSSYFAVNSIVFKIAGMFSSLPLIYVNLMGDNIVLIVFVLFGIISTLLYSTINIDKDKTEMNEMVS